MKSSFTLSQLAEGVHRRSLGADAPRLQKKWQATGLLEGLKGVNKDNMARLLENQAAELLKETANSLSTGAAGLASSGQVVGFTNVAFPIVRRVFAGLIANEIVSVQPMSLPAGLLFYLDYTYGNNVGGNAGVNLSGGTPSTYADGQSVYNNPRGAGVRSGSLATGGMYDLVGAGYSKVHKNSISLSASNADVGAWGAAGTTWTAADSVGTAAEFVGFNARYANYDGKIENDVADSVLDYCFLFMSASTITNNITGADLDSLEQVAITGFGSTPGSTTAWGEQYQGGAGILNLRKLNRRGNWNGSIFTPDPLNGSHVLFVLRLANGSPSTVPTVGGYVSGSAALADKLDTSFGTGATLTIPSFESDFGVNPASPVIPEVDIRIESTSVTATTRKLRARWSPEMAQDLTAFYSIDIEVELTNILSEMITLEIDREILNDLLTQAGAANLYWSRAPGKIVNKLTGAEALQSSTLSPGPMAFVNIQEWYQTLIETVSDVANTIYKKTLRGSANFLVTSPDVCTILEHLVSYKPAYRLDSDGQVRDSMTVGAEAVGTLNNRYTVYKDPYFPANKILVGLKGNTFLESGYIYAPYVPLILTPVIYAQDDFTPRKGVMTRYGKRMVRNDFYGTVTVLDLNLI